MDFLQRFNERDRERLLSAAAMVHLAQGEYLLRRGERGGEVYRVAEGELEIIDSRTQPAVVLDVVGKGHMVGEMAFLQDQARTADVRAGGKCALQRWDRRSLLAILDADPRFAAVFYRALAGMAVDRSRTMTTNVMSGGITGSATPANEEAAAAGRRLAQGFRARLADIEPLLRRDRAAAQQQFLAAAHTFSEGVHGTFARASGADIAAAGAEIHRELHPYVMRSHLGESSIDRIEGTCADTWTLAHVLHGRPKGDGPLGELIDAWFLDLPSASALRETVALAGSLLGEVCPVSPPFRFACVGAASAAPLDGQLEQLGRVGGEVVCVDGSREALSCVEGDLRARPRNVRLRLVQDDLAAVVLGNARVKYPPQDVVLAEGVLSYLPSTVAVEFLRWALAQLKPGGALLLGTVAPSNDDLLFRHLLRWPMVRRTVAEVEDLLADAGLEGIRSYQAGTAGIVSLARARGA